MNDCFALIGRGREQEATTTAAPSRKQPWIVLHYCKHERSPIYFTDPLQAVLICTKCTEQMHREAKIALTTTAKLQQATFAEPCSDREMQRRQFKNRAQWLQIV